MSDRAQERFRFQPSARDLAVTIAVAAVVAAAVVTGSGDAAVHAKLSTAPQPLSFYAAVSKKAFVDNNDDRARGEGRNPFGNYSNNVTVPTNERIYGPFPGDEGEILYTLYSNAAHTTHAGSAIFICQYNFNENQLCDASFRLEGGTLIGKGAANFNAKKFNLSIIGGTGTYRSMTGLLAISGLGASTQAKPVLRIVPSLQDQRLAGTIKQQPSAAPVTVTAYSRPLHEQFINNDDDEARGAGNNPFGGHVVAASAREGEGATGPFPGDEAVFTNQLFKTSDLKGGNGTVTYTCQYYFFKNGFCDATFAFPTGTLIAEGALNFNANHSAFTVIGGTGSYRGASGEIDASPQGTTAQQLTFKLL